LTHKGIVMAIPEACGLWIEQRIEEELQQKKDTGASLREIGRQVAAEVEKYCETKVSPDTIRKRAERQGGTNVPKPETHTITSGSPGDSGDITTIDPVCELNKETAKGLSVREAAKKVAKKIGKNSETIRKQYQRNKTQPKHDPPAEKEEEKPVVVNKPPVKLKNWREKGLSLQPDPTLIMSDGFNDAYDVFIKQVANAKRENWEKTSKPAILKCIETIMIYLED